MSKIVIELEARDLGGRVVERLASLLQALAESRLPRWGHGEGGEPKGGAVVGGAEAVRLSYAFVESACGALRAVLGKTLPEDCPCRSQVLEAVENVVEQARSHAGGVECRLPRPG